ncbi:MAG: SH3 domain-containing protein [Candidatus Melainabacteria bacterium]|jgi:uncharacterized protein YgiM (DUF1202 family)
MKKILSLINVFWLSYLLVCINHSAYSAPEAKPNGTTLYVFGDFVNVRSDASVKSKVLRQIPAGTRLLVVESKTINDEIWYKIGHGDSDEYVAASTLAEEATQIDGNKLLLLKRKSWLSKEGKLPLELRLIDSNKADKERIIQKSEFTVSSPDDGYNLKLEKIDNQGFKPALTLYKIEAYYEACGYPQTTTLFYISDNEIKQALSFVTSGEADQFDSTGDLIFPNDKQKGKPNTLKLIETTMTYKESKKKMTLDSTKVQNYIWDGKNLKRK